LANPAISLAEDVAAFGAAILALAAPLLVPVMLLIVGWVTWRVVSRLRRGSTRGR
jgi:hypothetical protein